MGALAFPLPQETAMPPELVLRRGGLTLAGTSVAARATAFAVPELGVALDLGRLTPAIAAQPCVLLSHGHLDHLAGVLAYLNVRARFHRSEGARLVAPAVVAARLRAALALLPGIESITRRLNLEAALLGVEAGQRVAVPGGEAEAFAVEHGVPALGWRLFRPGEARCALVFAADGSVAPFVAAPELLDAGVAVVECSVVEPNRRIVARLSGHAHLADWVELAPRLRCDTLVLAHLPERPAAELAAAATPLAEALAGEVVVWTRQPGGELASAAPR